MLMGSEVGGRASYGPMSWALCLLVVVCLTSLVGAAELAAPEVEKRIDGLIGQMTVDEKISLLSGTGMDTKPIARLGIPALRMTDGPHGVRVEQATCFPTGVALAASWDEGLVERVGAAMAKETLAKGRHVLLGPCINIHRTPYGGRNFESFSSDPYLSGRLAVRYVVGVQGQGVVACPKHYACNNQEWERTTIDVKVDARALREIYLPAFKAAVQEAGAWSIMGSYNRFNGSYACANRVLLTDILKNEWGFEGLVMSDWGAVHSTVKTANAGLDLEMPTGIYLGDALREAVGKGEVIEAVIDDKVRRILRVIIAAGLMGGPREFDGHAVDSPAHRALALQAARAGITLLKNDGGLLPLNRDTVRSIALIGPGAAEARLGGCGSSEVTPVYAVSPFEGILKQAHPATNVRFAPGIRLPGDYAAVDASFLVPAGGTVGTRGLRGEYFANRTLEGEPVLTRVDEQVAFDWGGGSPGAGLPTDSFSVRWTGKLIAPKTGDYLLAAISDDGSRLFLDGELIVDNWSDHAFEAKTHTVKLEEGHSYDIRFEFYEVGGAATVRFGWTRPGEDRFAEAVRIAKESDVAVVFAGLSKRFEGEGRDRSDLHLPGEQARLIQAVYAANPRTVVVLHNGTPVLMSDWADRVGAIVEAWYPGQEGGQAIAEVLFGAVNPSGKTTMTFPRRWEDCPAYGNYPGGDGVVRLAEGIFVDYRHFDRAKIEPQFPFGHGLSYTTFEYNDLEIKPARATADQFVSVSLSVTNTGKRAGQEVVQLYVRDVEASVERPDRELKGFRKLSLAPGQTRKVAMMLDRQSLSYYDPRAKTWTVEPGRFEVLVGGSSRDIRLQGAFEIE